MKHLLFALLIVASFPVIGQNILQIDQQVDINELKTGSAKTIRLNLSPADFISTHEQNYSYQAIIRLVNVPDSLAGPGVLKLKGDPATSVESSTKPGLNDLRFHVSLEPKSTPQEFVWTGFKLDKLLLLLPQTSTLPGKHDTEALQVDFCPDTDKVVYAKKRNWAYVWPKEDVRMVVRHINPLKYNVTLEASGIALNTDPGAALSAVSGVLNPNTILFKNSTGTSNLQQNPDVQELRNLALIAASINQRLNSIRQQECLDESDISRLKGDFNEYKELLDKAKASDEFFLQSKINWLAAKVDKLITDPISVTASTASTTTVAGKTTNDQNNGTSKADKSVSKVGSLTTNIGSTTSVAGSLTTTVTSLTTTNSASFSTNTAVIDRDKQYIRTLVEYAKDNQLAHRTFEQLNKLDDVIDGATLRLRPVSPSSYPDADIIRLTLTTSPRSNSAATPVKQLYDVLVVGRFKVDFSAGLVAAGLADQVYSSSDTTFRRITTTANKPDTSDITRSIPVAEKRGNLSLALATMAHFYWRLPVFNGGLNIGATVGGGITQKGRPIGLAGFSVLLGRAQRWVISTGWVIGTQKELAVRYDKTANYLNSQSSNDFTYIDRTIVDGFVSLTFNWGKNERVVSPDGITK